MRFHREVVQPELDEFRAEVRSRFDEMATKAELQTLRAEIATKAELQGLRTEMVAELVVMRSEMVTWPVLMRYHREIVLPEVEEVRSKLAVMAKRDDELLSHVDG